MFREMSSTPKESFPLLRIIERWLYSCRGAAAITYALCAESEFEPGKYAAYNVEVTRKDGLLLVRELAAEVKNYLDFKLNAVMHRRINIKSIAERKSFLLVPYAKLPTSYVKSNGEMGAASVNAVECCSQFLELCENNPEAVIKRSITERETRA
ncbi:hypothetical protein EVAR_79683_1 [Eumeta japonica]|uniref:Uncharacterized protein n=1 Tax=Eumeta variegata TaxID=151549 RepID=A0A4C1T984_EUMVA|nr:hypothetical protein EVAR_79683_1 [Eumeta japonica]